MISHMLTDKELEFVVELLMAESEKLMMESRHTDVRAIRDDVRDRLRTCDRLIERFKEIKGGLLTP